MTTLADRAISAGRWTAASAVARLAIQVLQTVILARMLGPQAFGAMAVVGSFLAILMVISDLGMSRALIHFDTLSQELLSNLFWCALAVSFGVALLFALAAPLLARGFNYPELAGVLATSSLIFPVTAAGQQLRTFAEKNFRFRELALSEILAAASGLFVGILLAFWNMGPYALLGAVLVVAAFNTIFAWVVLRGAWLPSRWTAGVNIGAQLRYGAYLMGDGLTSTVRMHADILIAATVAGPSAVGLYTVARDLALKVSNSLINPIITRVSLPLFARVQEDRNRLRAGYLVTMQIVSFLNFPIYFALGLYAPEIIRVLYGADWVSAALFLRLLAAWGLVRCVGNPVGSLLYAAGHVRMAFFWNAVFLVLVPPFLLFGAVTGGLHGLAWAMVLTQLAFFVIAWAVFVWPACNARLDEYVGSMAPAFLASLLAATCAGCATLHIESTSARLAVGGLAGSLAYALFTAILNRTISQRVFGALFSGSRRRP